MVLERECCGDFVVQLVSLALIARSHLALISFSLCWRSCITLSQCRTQIGCADSGMIMQSTTGPYRLDLRRSLSCVVRLNTLWRFVDLDSRVANWTIPSGCAQVSSDLDLLIWHGPSES